MNRFAGCAFGCSGIEPLEHNSDSEAAYDRLAIIFDGGGGAEFENSNIKFVVEKGAIGVERAVENWGWLCSLSSGRPATTAS